MMKLSVVIPSYNEADCIAKTVSVLYEILTREQIDHEILVINDHSTDDTTEILTVLKDQVTTLKLRQNTYPQGYGFAIQYGLDHFQGDCVAIVMGDASDDPEDLIAFYRKILEGYDAVFGSRFIKGGRIINYPLPKRILNRIVNNMIRILFGISYNDVTNAFKLFKREAINGLRPFLSPHFNMTVELPLKIISRGYSYAVIPNSWRNRTTGESKLKIKEMGSRYLFIIIYCLIEKWLVGKDYCKGSFD